MIPITLPYPRASGQGLGVFCEATTEFVLTVGVTQLNTDQ